MCVCVKCKKNNNKKNRNSLLQKLYPSEEIVCTKQRAFVLVSTVKCNECNVGLCNLR